VIFADILANFGRKFIGDLGHLPFLHIYAYAFCTTIQAMFADTDIFVSGI